MFYYLNIRMELNVTAATTTTSTATPFKLISHLRFCLLTCVPACFYHDDFRSVCIAFLIQLAVCCPTFLFAIVSLLMFLVAAALFSPSFYPSDRIVDIMNNFSLLFVLSTLINLTYSLFFLGQVLLSANTELGPCDHCFIFVHEFSFVVWLVISKYVIFRVACHNRQIDKHNSIVFFSLILCSSCMLFTI